MVDPIAVVLKFAVLGVLYLFVIWVARSANRDLARTAALLTPSDSRHHDQTGLYTADKGLARSERTPRLVVIDAPGLRAGDVYDLSEGAVVGRGDEAEIQIDDSFASSSHARFSQQGTVTVLEDLGSTNGTFLNGKQFSGPQSLQNGDEIRIGESEFIYEN